MLRQTTSTALLALAAAASLRGASAFSGGAHPIATCRAGPPPALLESFGDEEYEPPKEKGFFQNFFEELDAFVDDATSRRLGNGAQYYGKRKSSFYGKNDVNKKRNRGVEDPTEDYRGPNTAGYFKWMPDEETGELKPVTRMKNINIEKRSRS